MNRQITSPSSQNGTSISRPDTLSILIPDADSEFSLLVARCLAQIPGVETHILCHQPWTPIRFSRHHRQLLLQPQPSDPTARLAAICRAVDRSQADVILPVDESISQFIAAHLAEITPLAAVPPLASPDMLATVINKWHLATHLKRHHIPTPDTILYEEGDHFIDRLHALSFPALIKPVAARGGEGIHYFETPAEVLAYIDTTPDILPEREIIQAFIRGYDIDCSILCREGEILAYTIQRGVVRGVENFAASAGIQFTLDEEVLHVAKQFIAATNWSGIAHIDMRYDEEAQQIKLIEVNPRYWGSLIGSLIVGVNFPYLSCLAALDIPFARPAYKHGRYLAGWKAIRHGLKIMLGQADLDFSFDETNLPFALADPLAETVKLLYKTTPKNGLKSKTGF